MMYSDPTHYIAMTYNILVSRPLKYHLTMRVGGYYLLFIIVHGMSLLPRDTVTHTERNMNIEDGRAWQTRFQIDQGTQVLQLHR